MFLKWSFGNKKLNKLDTVGFGIPAFVSQDGFKTCPMAGACAAVCYARQGNYCFSNVKAAREFNLSVIRASVSDFMEKAIHDLHRLSPGTVRVHDSGDFFSQEYLDAWYTIARTYPDVTFYAYTKSLHLDLWTNKPDNFRIVQSEGGRMDGAIDPSQPHARIFATDYARRKAGYGDGSNTDTLAIRGANEIGLVYHGVRKLTDAQNEFFR